MLEFIKPFASDLRVTYSGGEPLMYPGFRQVVEAATNCGYRNELLTNGILVNEDRADFIAQHFTRVKISLDGADAATHAVGRGDNFSRVMRGIRLLSDRMANVTVQVTVGSWNLATADEVRALLPERVNVTYTPMLPYGRGKTGSKLFISDEEFLALSRRTRKPGSVAAGFEPGRQMRSCYAGHANLSIADSGDVYPCHLFHEPQFRLGNIFHDSFEEIFYGQRIREFVKTMDLDSNNPTCRECEVRYLCGGGCKANVFHARGDHHGVDLYCGYIKQSIIDNLFASVGVT